MKKLISAMLFCAPLSALAADATVDLKFTGTLLQPTCTASFIGSNGTDIAFGNVNASDIVGKSDDTVITAVPAKNVFLQLDNCGGGVTKIDVSFGGPAISGYGFNGKAPTFLNSGNASGLGFALFTDVAKTATADALSFKDVASTYPLSTLTKNGNTYKLPLFAKMVVARDTLIKDSSAINSNSAGKDLSASAYVNISYQ